MMTFHIIELVCLHKIWAALFVWSAEKITKRNFPTKIISSNCIQILSCLAKICMVKWKHRNLLLLLLLLLLLPLLVVVVRNINTNTIFIIFRSSKIGWNPLKISKTDFLEVNKLHPFVAILDCHWKEVSSFTICNLKNYNNNAKCWTALSQQTTIL